MPTTMPDSAQTTGPSGGQQPEQKSVLGFPVRPEGDGEAVAGGRHHWYELAQEVHGAFSDIDRAIASMQWSGDGRRAFDTAWSQLSGHGTETAQHSQEMGDHLLTLGHQIEDAQHQWDMAMAGMAASTAIGIGLTFVTFGISDAVAEGAAAAAVGTMEAVCAALDISLEVAVQVMIAAIRIGVQLTVKFTWQFGISVVTQETANALQGQGLDHVNLLQAAEFAAAATLIPGVAGKVTIGGKQVLEGAPGAVLSGALTDVGVQGMEGVTENKPFEVGEVVVASMLAGAGHIAGEQIGALVNKGVPKQEVPPRQVDLSFELEQHPDQVALAAHHVENWGHTDRAGHTSALHTVTLKGGGRGYFKPYTGEDTARRETFQRGSLWRNEVGVHEVDKALGLKLTATTTAVEAPVGRHGKLIRGSLADSVGTGYLRPDTYDPVDQQKAAVLHYVSGNTDGHQFNVLPQPDGRPGIIDGGLALPQGSADPIRSCFFPQVVGRQLDQSIVAGVKSVDEQQLVTRLQQTGISQEAIDGVLARLHEVQAGRITGAAYPG